MLDNGNIVRALPTRDAILPLICMFHTAKKEGKTISELVNDRFKDDYACYVWSGLIEASTKIEGEKGEYYTGLCQDPGLAASPKIVFPSFR